MNLSSQEISTFENMPVIVEAFVSQIDAAYLDVRRGPAVWTIREHIYHIADVQELLLRRITMIQKTPKPVIEPYFPEHENDLGHKFKSTLDALAEYKKIRQSQLVLLKECTSDDLNRNAEHREYTHYNIPLIIRHMIFHEYWHMYRIEELWLTKDEYFS
jgi:uncharacterized damage-inducible protein DinB